MKHSWVADENASRLEDQLPGGKAPRQCFHRRVIVVLDVIGDSVAGEKFGLPKMRSAGPDFERPIIKPAQPSNASGGTVTVATRAGQTITGVLRNEDNFSLQLQSLDGAFHLLMKSDVASMTRDSNSLMPADYGSTLSASELNDLVSFLMSVDQQNKSSPDPKENEPSDEEE